jgi:hypothetical protein
MKILDLTESSGYSFSGSWTPDLVFSKIWLLQQLAKIKPEVSTMYILGSWFGNLAFMVNYYGFPRVEKLINVEADKKFLKTGKQVLDTAGYNNIEYMLKDANDLDYRQLDGDSVVVNTSLTDMPGRDWFTNLPDGQLVVLQGRDQDPNRNFYNPQDILKRFPFNQVIYQGRIKLKDPETEYYRSMVIGLK